MAAPFSMIRPTLPVARRRLGGGAAPLTQRLLPRLRWVAKGLLALLALVLPGDAAPAANDECRVLGFALTGWDAGDAAEICTAVQDAIDLLRPLGIELRRGVVVRPQAASSPSLDPGGPLGHFDVRSNQVVIRSFESAVQSSAEGDSACSAPMTRAVWRSYIAHELAHAAAERYFAAGVARHAASEYIAAVTQLSVLDRDTRAQILARYAHVSGWSAAREISINYYFIDPCGFAVKCFRHFSSLAPAEQRRFFAQLLHRGL